VRDLCFLFRLFVGSAHIVDLCQQDVRLGDEGIECHGLPQVLRSFVVPVLLRLGHDDAPVQVPVDRPHSVKPTEHYLLSPMNSNNNNNNNKSLPRIPFVLWRKRGGAAVEDRRQGLVIRFLFVNPPGDHCHLRQPTHPQTCAIDDAINTYGVKAAWTRQDAPDLACQWRATAWLDCRQSWS
jgi:hypothetical protein